jgi:CRP/FNR family transcriptional regulator, cyclic AMP receptor protein
MRLSKRADRLRDTAPFDSLGEDDLERAADLADEVCLPAGYLVVDDDDRHDHLLVIAAGTATAFHADGTVLTLGPGTVIGELSPLGWNARAGRIVASTRLRLFMFDPDGFAAFVTDHPHLLPRTDAMWASSRRRSFQRSNGE